MVKKTEKTIFVCRDCGGEHISWAGKCSYCGQWNTLKEMKSPVAFGGGAGKIEPAAALRLGQIKSSRRGKMATGISELDLVLGGGLVAGEVALLGGNPGIGKSTLVWQIAGAVGKPVCYVAGEESPEQIKVRAERLGIEPKDLIIFDSGVFEAWAPRVEKISPSLLIIDSIQSVASDEFPASAGSIIQVKECALKIIALAKKLSIATILVGHVTKEGEVAGPKTLEHLVDAVFYLEGEKGLSERFLRSQKNRFGSTDEVGFFRVTERGLSESPDFGRLKPRKDLPFGICRTAACEGSRIYFAEVQSLTIRSSFGFAKRNSVGFDLNRLQMMVAVLSSHTGVDLQSSDIFVNLADGYRLRDPLGDLAVVMSLVSSAKKIPLSGDILALGEVDLAGRVHLGEPAKKIIRSAQKAGYKVVTSPGGIREVLEKHFGVI